MALKCSNTPQHRSAETRFAQKRDRYAKSQNPTALYDPSMYISDIWFGSFSSMVKTYAVGDKCLNEKCPGRMKQVYGTTQLECQRCHRVFTPPGIEGHGGWPKDWA
eukprot:g79491.t1